jgi:hypothetical protein
MKIGLQTLQIVLYTSSLDLSDKLGVAEIFSQSKKLNLKGEPSILPIPNDAPLEIPRIILKNKDGSRELTISPARIDMFLKAIQTSKDGMPILGIDSLKDEVKGSSKELAKNLKVFNANLNRVALVSNFIIKLTESSKKYILDKFIKKGTIKEPEEIKLHILNKEIIGEYKVNEWVRFETLRNVKNPKDDKALRILIDINSVPEAKYNFTEKNIDSFYEKALKLITEELKALK